MTSSMSNRRYGDPNITRSFGLVACILLLVVFAPTCVRAQCSQQWIDPNLPFHGLDDAPYAAAVFDSGDGSGPHLYVGGHFRHADGSTCVGVAMWTGSSWLEVGGGLYSSIPVAGGAAPFPGWINSMVVFKNKLVVAGYFVTAGTLSTPDSSQSANNILAWDGKNWSRLGPSAYHYGLQGGGGGVPTEIQALVVHDDGTGPALIAAGNFSQAGSVSASYIARWDGVSGDWTPLGSGSTDSWIFALASYNGKLYAGGAFSTIAGYGGMQGIADWNGANWQSIGGVGTGLVTSLLAFDPDGSGPAPAVLVVGGDFTNVGTTALPASSVAIWNGTVWSAMGSGVLSPAFASSTTVEALTSLPAAGGMNTLYAAFDGTQSGNTSNAAVAVWNGSVWNPAPINATGLVYTLQSVGAYAGGPAGPSLVLGGTFTTINGQLVVSGVGQFDGTNAARFGAANSAIISNPNVPMFLVSGDEDGSGPIPPSVYAYGQFSIAGNVFANNIARLGPTGWQPVGSGVPTDSTSVPPLFYNDGTGQHMFVVNSTGQSGDDAFANILTKWDGATWTAVPGFVAPGGFVFAATVYKGEIYVAGNFTGIWLDAEGNNQIVASNIAKWNGSAWTAVSPAVFSGNSESTILTLGNFNGNLVAGGLFDTIDTTPANRIAIWDGSNWSNLGPLGVGEDPSVLYSVDRVVALITYNDKLYVGGRFNTAGGVAVNHIASWDGNNWASVGTGVGGSPLGSAPGVLTLQVADDGSGPALFACGSFTTAGSTLVNCITKWNGASFAALGSGLSWDYPGEGHQVALSTSVVSLGRNLYVSGAFNQAGTPAIGSWGFVEWGSPACCPADFNQDGRATVQDIFSFLASWFAHDSRCDFNHSGPPTVQDIFTFLVEWFRGC